MENENFQPGESLSSFNQAPEESPRLSPMEDIKQTAREAGAERRQRLLQRLDLLLGTPEAVKRASELGKEAVVDKYNQIKEKALDLKERTQTRLQESKDRTITRLENAKTRFTNRVDEIKQNATDKANQIKDRATEMGMSALAATLGAGASVEAKVWDTIDNLLTKKKESKASSLDESANAGETELQSKLEKFKQEREDLTFDQLEALVAFLQSLGEQDEQLKNRQLEEGNKLNESINTARETAEELRQKASSLRRKTSNLRYFNKALSKITS